MCDRSDCDGKHYRRNPDGPLPAAEFSFTLRDAHAPYLDELNLCQCDLCRDARGCSCALCRIGIVCDEDRRVAYTRGISERLLALIEGRHRHVTFAEYVATLPKQDGPRTVQGYRIGRDDRVHGLGIGLSSH